MERCGCLDEIGANRVFQGKNAAIHAVYQKLDKSRCAACDKRIFLECQEEFGPAPRRPTE
jgi:SulP family sulfate permease